MQIKIQGEQPFQVLGTNFTIGPSSSGYDLYFSADGRSYSKLFTVGADTNRQVTQVAAGSYYVLSGNTDEVTVNWMKDCGGGEGGGTYVLPTASENTLGGVKIGSGITIDANGAISAQGGSGGDSNYVIVNDLSAVTNPTEGMIAYVPLTSAETTYQGVRYQVEDVEEFGYPENYFGWVRYWGGEWNEEAFPIYISEQTFHWDFTNDGQFHANKNFEINGQHYSFGYITHGEEEDLADRWIDVFPLGQTPPSGDWIYDVQQGVGTASTSYTTTVWSGGVMYRYNGTDWEEMHTSNCLVYEQATAAEAIAFRDKILRDPNSNYYLSVEGRHWYFGEFYEEKPSFFFDWGGGTRSGYSIYPDGEIMQDRYDPVQPTYMWEILMEDTGGTINGYSAQDALYLEQPYRAWIRYNITDGAWSFAPLKYVYRDYEEVDGETKLVYHIAAEIMIGGTLYRGTWHWPDWEHGDHITPDSWTAV